MNDNINNESISKKEIIDIFNNVSIIQEPKVPFPQVDVLSDLISILDELYSYEMSREDIMTLFEMKNRQFKYYMSAGSYLGVLEQNNNKYSLNEKGKEIFSHDLHDRNLEIVKLILEHKPFRDVYKNYLIHGTIPHRDIVADILKENNIYNVKSEVTLKRRATSTRSWIKWLVNLYEDAY